MLEIQAQVGFFRPPGIFLQHLNPTKVRLLLLPNKKFLLLPPFLGSIDHRCRERLFRYLANSVFGEQRWGAVGRGEPTGPLQPLRERHVEKLLGVRHPDTLDFLKQPQHWIGRNKVRGPGWRAKERNPSEELAEYASNAQVLRL